MTSTTVQCGAPRRVDLLPDAMGPVRLWLETRWNGFVATPTYVLERDSIKYTNSGTERIVQYTGSATPGLYSALYFMGTWPVRHPHTGARVPHSTHTARRRQWR